MLQKTNAVSAELLASIRVRRLTISWTCKRCTACDLAWSDSGRP